MNGFGWPATLKRTKGGVELSFPDWPDIVETGTTVQEAVIRARDALNRAVMLRIGEGTRIPLPSELQPGQLHVPIAEEVAVHLEAYLEERDKEYFREAAELQRVQHDLRAAFFTERRAHRLAHRILILPSFSATDDTGPRQATLTLTMRTL